MAGDDFVGSVIRDTWDEAQSTLRRALVVAGRTATAATARQVTEIIDVFERNVGAAERLEFFETLGRRAQDAVLRSYRSQTRGPSGYRANDKGKMRRYAGGLLEGALSDPDNIFEATPNGITFLPNPRALDAQARQWYRLNFGAGPNFGRRSGRFDVSMSNIFLFSIGFEAEPSDPFRIPRGFWIEGGSPVEAGTPGTSEFYPRRSAAQLGLNVGRSKQEQKSTPFFFPGRSPARGIQAEHWLDAGLRRFTEDLSDPGRDGVGLRGLYIRFYERGIANVRPTRPPVVGLTAVRGSLPGR